MKYEDGINYLLLISYCYLFATSTIMHLVRPSVHRKSERQRSGAYGSGARARHRTEQNARVACICGGGAMHLVFQFSIIVVFPQ